MKHTTKIITLASGYHLFSASFGNPNAKIKLLALHGGPGDTSNEFFIYADELKKYANLDVQIITYDQLGSFYSESPDFTKKENVARYLNFDYYREEVEAVRNAWHLDQYYLIGHSWGGALVYEYALKYQRYLKAGIVFSMTDNIDDYIANINKQRLNLLGQTEVDYMHHIEQSHDYLNARYHGDLVKLYRENLNRHPNYDPDHGMAYMAEDVYGHFQGNNEFVVTGSFRGWNVHKKIQSISIPMLVTFGEQDTMPADSGRKSVDVMPNARFNLTLDGGHSHAQDHPQSFFSSLGQFIEDVEQGKIMK